MKTPSQRQATLRLISAALFLVITLLPVLSQDARLASYHVIWTEQSKNASESMPLLGGDIGCNVWVEDGDILMYVQRSGSLSENGEYLKLGRFRFRLNPNPFGEGASFRQELKLSEGYIEISSTKSEREKELNTRVKLWIEVHRPIVHVDVESDLDLDVEAFYESWRTEDKELLDVPDDSRERFTCFNLEGYPGKVVRVKDEIEFSNGGVLFYHRNPEYKLVPDYLIQQQGLEAHKDHIYDDIKNRTFGGLMLGEGFMEAGKDEGIYQITPFLSWKIKSGKAGKEHHLAIITQIDQAEDLENWKSTLFALAETSLYEHQKAHKETVGWWNKFWERSYIFIQPGNEDPENPVWQMSRNYQLFRYQLGGNALGEYPTKFNGGNLIYDPVLVNEGSRYEPDWRQWGGAVHTAQNQRLLYWPMLKAGDFEAMLPQFELYRKGLAASEARVKTHFGHDGAVFSEYMSASGLALGAGWGWEGQGHRARGKEIPFGDERAHGARGYKDLVEKGVMANQSIAYHWESQVEHAYMILEYQRYSGKDISQYMPFIKSAIRFFDEHYQLRQTMRNGQSLDEHGKLVIFPSTSCESYRGAKNPTDLIAGLRASIEAMLELDEMYLSADEKRYYKEYLQRIPGYAFEEVEGLRIIKPAESWLKEANLELPQFYPLFPFDQFHLDDKEIQSFKNAYSLAPDFRKGIIQSWHQDGIQFARMGMAREAAEYNTKKLQDSPRRFPTFWGPGHDWVPDHNWGGSGMIGLQEMLMQAHGDKILLFPAWPRGWDVDFKLHAPKNTTVEVSLKDGELVKLQVNPEYREKDVIMYFE